MIKNFSNNAVEYKKINSPLKIAIIRSNYHQNLTKSLEEACKKQLLNYGVKADKISVFEVPGSWEIPVIAKKLAASKKFDGIIAFGVIIKGETYHFEILAHECAKTLMNIALEFDIPVTFEVLATYNLAQAKKRSVGKYNKGVEAAQSLLETIKTLSKIQKL